MMPDMKKPVVVYAASGYTGRLTCQALTRRKVPFIAAGRNQQRLDAVVQECRAEGGDCVAQVAEHTPASLQALFRGTKVVINISGPFSKLGRAVVDACLQEGCHYLDTTGEQDFMSEIRTECGPHFLRAKLLLSPSAAFLWAPAPALTELCLESERIDSIKIAFAPPVLQTVASLQSMMRTLRRPVYRIANRELAKVPLGEVRRVVVPGTEETRGALNSGGSETFFLGDSRILNYETLFASDGLVKMVGFAKLLHRMTGLVGGDRVDRWTDAWVLKNMKDPPPESEETSRYTVTAVGDGPTERVSATIYGVAPYIVTGALCADAAKRLLSGEAKRFGYVSLAHTFGPNAVFRVLEEAGARLVVNRAATQTVNSGFFQAQSA
jgi:hypothetical protein